MDVDDHPSPFEISEYERKRQERIKENQKLLQSLNISFEKDAISNLFTTPIKQAKKVLKKDDQSEPLDRINLERRSSSRLQGKDYSYKDQLYFPISKLFISESPKQRTDPNPKTTSTDSPCRTPGYMLGIRKKGGRVFDPINGTSCHQCRQKTTEEKVICTKSIEKKSGIVQCGLAFDERCLLGRYGITIEEVKKIPNWVCPRCQGLCNCSLCLKKRGEGPIPFNKADVQRKGYSCILDYLGTMDMRSILLTPCPSSTNNNDSTEESENSPSFHLTPVDSQKCFVSETPSPDFGDVKKLDSSSPLRKLCDISPSNALSQSVKRKKRKINYNENPSPMIPKKRGRPPKKKIESPPPASSNYPKVSKCEASETKTTKNSSLSLGKKKRGRPSKTSQLSFRPLKEKNSEDAPSNADPHNAIIAFSETTSIDPDALLQKEIDVNLTSPINTTVTSQCEPSESISTPTKSSESEVDDKVFEVEDIIDMRYYKKTNKRRFKLKWKGYEELTWENEDDMNCKELIEEFLLKRKEIHSPNSPCSEVPEGCNSSQSQGDHPVLS